MGGVGGVGGLGGGGGGGGHEFTTIAEPITYVHKKYSTSDILPDALAIDISIDNHMLLSAIWE